MAEEQVDVGTPEPAAPPPPMNEAPADGPGSGRGELRKQLEKSVDSVRKAQQPPVRDTKGKYVSTARQQAAEEQTAAPAEGEQPIEGQEAAPATEYKVPEGWAKEAKAEWANIPPVVQAAVAKRETDMAKGVDDIKKKYAEIDQALQPRLEVIRRHGHTPAQAVNQLFAWFESLSANPLVAFPALAQSFKFDLRSIPGLVPHGPTATQPQQAAASPPVPATGQPAGDVPPALQAYIDQMNQRLEALQNGFTQQIGQLSTSFQQASQAKTEEILANWSKDKPYFEDVRKMMAHLISSQAVPPLPNGSADLDKAYDMALWALPEVRQKILADQQKTAEDAAKAKQAAERQAQQAQADKARKAQAGSLGGSAPGSPDLPAKPKKGKSVAESIRDSIKELSE